MVRRPVRLRHHLGAVAPLCPWDQEGPIDGTTTDWNQYCPSDPTTAADRCVTGCTATAEAQVLYYWHFPQSISFSASDNYTSQGTDGPINIPGDATKYSFPSFATLAPTCRQSPTTATPTKRRS